MSKTWSGVRGTFEKCVAIRRDQPDWLKFFFHTKHRYTIDVEIEFEASGHSEPGVWSDESYQKCRPPEFVEKRTFIAARVDGKKVSDEIAYKLLSFFEDEIAEVEVYRD